MAEAGLTCRTDDGIATIAFDRPACFNAIDSRTVALLAEALERAETDDRVSVVVLRGQGGNFSAGADIKEPLPSREELLAIRVDRHPAGRLRQIGKPTIAAIRGYCLGGALELALACDFRLLSDDAILGFAEIDWALTTGWGGAGLLAGMVGREMALDLLLTGRRFDATEAGRIGIARKVVAADAFETELLGYARALAAAPRDAVRGFKRILLDRVGEDTLKYEFEIFAEVADGVEARRRLADFGRGLDGAD